MSQARFQKRQREMQRAEKAKAKAARKADRLEAAAETSESTEPVADPEKVMAQLEALHKAFADEKLSFDDFEEKKQELLSQLQV